MSDLHSEVQLVLNDAAQKLEKKFPHLKFIFTAMPYHKTQLRHLSTEQRNELEKVVANASAEAFNRYVQNPNQMRPEDMP